MAAEEEGMTAVVAAAAVAMAAVEVTAAVAPQLQSTHAPPDGPMMRRRLTHANVPRRSLFINTARIQSMAPR